MRIMTRADFKIEVCANSPVSCLAAQEGGADRVELCGGIPEGGTTPSYGMIRRSREIIDIALNVIIRPRGGDFLYSDSEIRQMLYDIELAKDCGADGLVFGCLRPGGNVDMFAMEKLMKASDALPVTFHRAFDVVKDHSTALEDLISLGCARVLTSGGRANALAGALCLASLVRQASDRISIMPGCGIREHNIMQIAELTSAREFHFSAREYFESKMLYINKDVSFNEDGTNGIMQTTPDKVKATIDKLLFSTH